jgi:flagellin-like hook-associated protein FlgL
MAISPVPTTRIGDLFVRQRLTSQVQRDQLALFRLQNQISTGQRLQLPSEDAPSALRAISLQRLIDRKSQIRTNIEAGNQYLGGADARLASIASGLNDLRGAVVGVSGNTVPQSSRLAVMQDIDSLLQELVNAGNAKLQGRYLFAGSRSQSQPYDYDGKFVEFSGNDGALRSYVDLERLFETNVAGTDVFGGVSAQVVGSVDLNPHLTENTLVSSLNGGNGIGANPAIRLSVDDGTSTTSVVVDLTRAVTMGDVARFIENAAPATSDLRVDVTGTGLVLRSNRLPTPDTISISEVAEGRTARLLGINSDPNVTPTNTITGLDLNPAVLKTTRLSDLLGKKSQGVIQLTGANNDIRITAAANGDDFDNVTVEFVTGATAGSESASYNAGTNTLTVQVHDGESTASQIAAAINTEGTFTAVVDYHDATSFVQAGTGTIELGGASPVSINPNTTGGADGVLDTASGFIVTNGGQSATINLSSAETVEDLLNLINGAELGLVAEVNATATGINVKSRLSGADFTVGENGGTTATQLGIRSYNGTTQLSAFNRGIGVSTTADNEQLDTTQLDELQFVARNGVAFTVDLTGATSLQDIVDEINADPLNFGNTKIEARVSDNGNGIELVDKSTPLTGDLQIVGGTLAAKYLGFVAQDATQNSSHLTDAAGNYLMSGRNVLGHDLMIETRNGRQVWIDLGGAQTVQDVLNRINNDPENTGPQAVTARLATNGNGIELVDNTVGAGALTIHSIEGSSAAQHLGFLDAGQTEVSSTTGTLTSEDRHTLETDSVFNTLIRLRAALATNNNEEISNSLERLDVDLDRVNFARAEIGSRLQNLEVIQTRLEDENVELQAALSQEMDVDLVEAISQLTARQYAFEASLRSSASIMQLTLLNFL